MISAKYNGGSGTCFSWPLQIVADLAHYISLSLSILNDFQWQKMSKIQHFFIIFFSSFDDRQSMLLLMYFFLPFKYRMVLVKKWQNLLEKSFVHGGFVSLPEMSTVSMKSTKNDIDDPILFPKQGNPLFRNRLPHCTISRVHCTIHMLFFDELETYSF